MSSLVITDKLGSNEIIVLSCWIGATFVLLYCAGPTRYLKVLCLGHSLSCRIGTSQ